MVATHRSELVVKVLADGRVEFRLGQHEYTFDDVGMVRDFALAIRVAVQDARARGEGTIRIPVNPRNPITLDLENALLMAAAIEHKAR